MNRLVCTLLLSLALVGCRSYFERAENCADDGDYESAFELYQQAADSGDVRAWNSLGVAYCQGRGVPVNYARAFICFKKGADAGLPGSICNLGHCYRYGYGVERSIPKAEEYYRLAAATRMPQALYNLGMYYMEQKSPTTKAQGFALIRQCAEYGYAPAQFQIAMCYLNGTGVAKDQLEGAVWLLITSRGDGNDAATAGKLLLDLAKTMKSDDIAKIRERADAFRNDHSGQ